MQSGWDGLRTAILLVTFLVLPGAVPGHGAVRRAKALLCAMAVVGCTEEQVLDLARRQDLPAQPAQTGNTGSILDGLNKK